MSKNELIKPKNRVYCPIADRPKMVFENESKALNFIKFNGEGIEELNGYAPVRAYYCTGCAGWHLTHLGKKKNLDKRIKLSELRPRDPLSIGVRYHLCGIIQLLDEVVESLEEDGEEIYATQKEKTREALHKVYDLKISPYKDEMKSVQKLITEFAFDLIANLNASWETKNLGTEIAQEFIKDWKYYMSFLGYLKIFNDRRADNPKIKYILNNKELFEEWSKYIKCLHCLKRYFILVNTGHVVTKYKVYQEIIDIMTDEELINDLEEKRNNIPVI